MKSKIYKILDGEVFADFMRSIKQNKIFIVENNKILPPPICYNEYKVEDNVVVGFDKIVVTVSKISN